MNEHPHLDRETAEHLLDSAGATHDAGVEELARLLRQAAAPARPQELSGEDSAVAAFLAVPPAKNGSRLRRWITFKIAAIITVVTAGGLAWASSAGILPAPFEDKPAPRRPATTQPLAPTTPPRSSSSPGQTPPTSGGPQGQQQLAGLCNALMNKPPSQRGRMLESSAFSGLVAAAGGVDNVEAFCASLPDDKSDKSKSPKAHQ